MPGSNAGLYLRTVLASLALALVVVAGVSLWAHASLGDSLPPPPLTGNISFDEKACFVRKALHQDYDVVAAGSSLTLCDLSSPELRQALPEHPRVLNIAAWGLRIEDTRRWLNHVLKFVHPRTVVIVLGAADFEQAESFNITDSELDGLFSDGWRRNLLLLRKLSFVYYAKNWRTVAHQRLDRTGYSSLRFDDGGAAPLDMAYPDVDPVRWNGALKPELVVPGQYHSLSMLARELRARRIDLVAVQAPSRSRAFEAARPALEAHWRRVETILGADYQCLIKTQDELKADDTLFADYQHLNARGASAFTRELARRIQVTDGITR